jgi:hypothetical protein
MQLIPILFRVAISQINHTTLLSSPVIQQFLGQANLSKEKKKENVTAGEEAAWKKLGDIKV